MENEFDIEFKNYLYQVLGKDNLQELESNDEDGECYLKVGSKLSIDLSEDMVSLLTDKDSLLVILRFPSEAKKSFRGVSKGKVDFGFQLFKREDFDINYDFVGFTLSIKDAVDYSDMRLDFNFTPEGFEFSEKMNYALNIIAIDEKHIVRAMRHIRFPRELCKIIREYYLKITREDYNREVALEDLENLDAILFDGITSKQVEESFSLYKFTDEPEESNLDKYIKD
ncbi:hypothetical protein [Clostridium perfringens]|jgi:hypothetical protein|uniref:Uncharacterized protein n=1 Tax=Clostridium perfringens TaxID=1502 RepID=A0AAE8FT14_CLOPF|nr:hypothetical protein [Clostridium perfringens]EHK2400478.1 hypothetical protein [Clostridium perfringens]EIF6288173.1 hypothetical protein [Clostridium perfringens]EJT5930812.1 hypothetical protein [Clostridium perfringens]EJT6162075.1 hypothetical protein [Clostridium perfringens]EJT6478179.1 hypothetical protein [Clostridium perfringens]